MAKLQLLLFVFFFLFNYSTWASICPTSRCSEEGPAVRFPFRLRNLPSQPPGCSYDPGFALSCHLPTFQTTLTLPPSTTAHDNFIVQHIDYEAQTLYVNDPNGCLPQRFLHRTLISLHDTPFRIDSTFQNYTFLNCSTQALQNQTASLPVMATSVSCLGSENHTVFAAPSTAYDDWLKSTSSSSSWLLCTVISSVLIPTSAYQLQEMSGDVRLGVRLTWSWPDCRDCETEGGNCGFNRNTNRTLCSYPTVPRKGLPRSAKYGIIIGVGIPGLLCILGLASYVFGRIKAYGGRRQPNMDLPSSVSRQATIVAVGLDGPTIESYPKTLLGESKRLPKPNDNMCSICLSEYQPKEELRTIPECNHYFHSSCIDEWLKMNATCPMCRKSPEGSSLVTPSSSTSSSTFSSASSIAIELT